jgi:transposase
MQTRREQLSYEMTLLPPLESLIPAGHRLRKLNRVIDLSFVHAVVRDRYCQDNGRPSIDPEVVLRLFMLQAIEGIRSVRELMNEVQVNLAYRWFIGYRVDEPLPDHSTLSRALDRFGDDVFDTLFARSIAQCQQSGLLDGRVLHLDATVIRADIDKDHVGQPESSDPDARFGHGAGGRKEPGYKQQTVVDDRSRVIVGLTVMPANEHDSKNSVSVVDQAISRLCRRPEAVCADAAYANGPNAAAMEERSIRLVSPPQRPRTTSKERYFTIEYFPYDSIHDVFTCPAGQTLRFIGVPKDRPDRRKYRAPRAACRVCALKDQCTQASVRVLKVGVHHDALVRLRADCQTTSFRVLYHRRSPVIEGVFGESKQWHGLRRAWRRGLSNMLIQSLLIAAVMNYKRLAVVCTRVLVDLIAVLTGQMAPQTAHATICGKTEPKAANGVGGLAATPNY